MEEIFDRSHRPTCLLHTEIKLQSSRKARVMYRRQLDSICNYPIINVRIHFNCADVTWNWSPKEMKRGDCGVANISIDMVEEALHFSNNLQQFPSFSNWLEDNVQYALASGEEVSDVVRDVSIPPKFSCRKFRSMWAFGSRFCVASYERSFSTRDCGMAAIFVRPWWSSARDPNPEEVNIEYVGKLEEIVELDYKRTCVVVFVCRWIKSNYRGANAIIIRDKWGFTLANFQSCERFGKESFIFPKHCEHVFWSDAPK